MGDVIVPGARATTRAPAPVKAYLDNCLVGVLVKAELPEELAAIHELIELWHAGQLAFVTSPVTLEEIQGVPEEHRAPHEAVYALLAKVPVEADVKPGQHLAFVAPRDKLLLFDAETEQRVAG